MRMEKVIKTSDIAKQISKPTKASEAELKFGKIFEEEYTRNTWLVEKHGASRISSTYFRKKLAARLKSAGLEKWIRKGYRMYACLLKNKVVGRKPPTAFRKINDITVAGQPDLVEEHWREEDKYYEFKTHPIDDYARTQAEIFSWVLRKPIILVGLKEDEEGYIHVEKERIYYSNQTENKIKEAIKKLTKDETL